MRRAILMALVLLILLQLHVLLMGVHAQTSKPSLKINWVQYSNPTPHGDLACGVCVYGDYVYVVGGDGYVNPRIEMRRKSDGSLIKSWSSNMYYGDLYECLVINNILIVLGTYEFYLFDTSLNLKEIIPRYNESLERISSPRSFLFDGGYIYTVDTVFTTENDSAWLVSVFDVENLSKPLKTTLINPTHYDDIAIRIGLNPVTNHLWIVGSTDIGEKLLSIQRLESRY